MTRSYSAVDPPGDEPRSGAMRPPFDSCPVVDEQLLVKGWALSRCRSNEISVEVDVGKPIEAHCGLGEPTRAMPSPTNRAAPPFLVCLVASR